MGLYINQGELRDRAGVSLVTQKARKTQKGRVTEGRE